MRNRVQKIFRKDGTWTCPAGVTKVIVETYTRREVIGAGQQCGFASVLTDDATLGPAWWNSWGLGTTGGLGSGATTSRSLPGSISAIGRLRQISSGEEADSGHGVATIALSESGIAYGTGANVFGQLGQNNTTTRSALNAVAGTRRYRCVTTNGMSSAAVGEDGLVYTWGRNNYGQLGSGTTTDRSSPVAVSGISNIVQVVAPTRSSNVTDYGAFMLALTADGAVYAWGANTYGQLGSGNTTNRSTPTLVSGGRIAKWITAGSINAGLLTTGGDAYAWGDNFSGMLGDNTGTGRSSPVAVVGGYKFREFMMGDGHSYGIVADGTLYGWGNGVGDNTLNYYSSPIAVGGGKKYTRVHAGGDFSMGVSADGLLYSWGGNFSGQLGDGSTTGRSSPVLVGSTAPVRLPSADSVARAQITVVPGTTYSVAYFSHIASFAGLALGVMPTEIRLLY